MAKCRNCHGDGVVDCAKCKGEGEFRSGKNKEGITCPNCKGSGDVKCSVCNGTGFRK
ncbi:hypothetical protein I0Q91_04790 [Halanaerobiaceae bacterium Z-7014]|uniref:BSD2 cysteine rich domain-containing protein n=1 Tax=Halonatronomonas betaini TaxID=2778430 RepID=A0A931ATK4_9FIRM|nr:hypothetical protein [Halonatronomonas betaini]MBF8436389.1 hypothetical protein [Halonatronomonas betaini]